MGAFAEPAVRLASQQGFSPCVPTTWVSGKQWPEPVVDEFLILSFPVCPMVRG